MASRSITFISPAAGWVQVSPVLPAAGGVDVTNLPDVALRETPGRGTYSITWDDEGWSDWSASGAVSDGGSVQTTSDLTPAGIQAMLEASVAKSSAKPSGGPGALRPAPPARRAERAAAATSRYSPEPRQYVLTKQAHLVQNC